MVSILGKRKERLDWLTPAYLKAQDRAAKLSTHELLNWADVAGTAMAQAFADYRKHGADESLIELKNAVSQMAAVIEELQFRDGADI